MGEGGDADAEAEAEALTDLGGEDGEVDAGEALEVLPEEALGVVLPDLLARHGERRREKVALDWKVGWLVTGAGRAAGSGCTLVSQREGRTERMVLVIYISRDSEEALLMQGLDGI